NYLSAVSMAVSMGGMNRMPSSLINAITTEQWNGSGGFAEDQTRFDMTVTLHSDNVELSPAVSGAVLNVQQEGLEAKVVGTGGDYSVFSSGGQKTVNKQNEGTSLTTIYYTN
ncbi:MAG: hypothetical protein KKE17_15705, partial [Proteobacteria bacterium]|nr:hypothetical protein [Pseudomonadota bacterium]